MPSELVIGRIRDGVAIRVVGRGTMQESIALRKAVEPFLSGRRIVFDATQCEYLDSTFLGCLVGINKACECAGCRFVIAAPAASRAKLFATSSLDRYFDFIDSCPPIIGHSTAIVVSEPERIDLGRHVMRCHEHLAERGGAEAAVFDAIVKELARELGEERPELAASGR
jgi:anti-anti-sigma factor